MHIRRKLAALVTAAGLICTLTVTSSVVLGAGGSQSADIDQCANGSGASIACLGNGSGNTGWVNGNLGASKSHYSEGQSIPYRIRFSNLQGGASKTHTVTIQWDTTKGGKHAIDYLTNWDANVVATSDPKDTTSVTGAAANYDIPIDSSVGSKQNAHPSVATQHFSMYGGTISGLSAYALTGTYAGDSSTSITISFTATGTSAVLAWGGHIASRADWGAGGSAVSITGSPFHTRLLDLDGSGGNQDRSLSNDAVTFPGSITIIKDAQPNSSTATFSFTASPSPLGNFTLKDDGTGANLKLFSNITDFQTYTVTEGSTTGWNFDSASCSVSSGNGGTQSVSGTTATVSLKEGENVTCTYINKPTPAPHLTIDKVDNTGSFSKLGDVINYTITATNDGNVTLTAVTVTDPNASSLSCNPANGSSLASGASMTCTASHTITQADLTAGSYYNQACVDDGPNGAAQACDDVTTQGTQKKTLSIIKSDDLNPAKYDHIGQVITYTITATNTGNVPQTITVSDTPALASFGCTPTNGTSVAPGASMVCTGTHTVTQADLTAGSFYDNACADASGATQVCDDDTVNGKKIPSIVTTDTLLPKDHIVLSGLTANATGTLSVELRIDEACGAQTVAPYSATFPVSGSTKTVDVTSDVAVTHDATVRWCTKYSGDANNAMRDWADDGEVIGVDFDPEGILGFGAGALAMLAYSLWARRRRERED